MGICEDSRDFGRGFVRLWEDSRGFARLWERIHKDSQDFGRGLKLLLVQINMN